MHSGNPFGRQSLTATFRSIAYAKAQGADGRINFPAADACAIPFSDSTFDITLSMLVLAFTRSRRALYVKWCG